MARNESSPLLGSKATDSLAHSQDAKKARASGQKKAQEEEIGDLTGFVRRGSEDTLLSSSFSGALGSDFAPALCALGSDVGSRGVSKKRDCGKEERKRILVIMSALWIGNFLGALDMTIVASLLSVVSSEFGVSKSASWLGTSYLLTQTAFQPLYGKLSDIFGRRTMAAFASGTFLVGSLLCGLSLSFTQLCVFRALAGIGGGGLMSMSSIITSDLVSLESRGTWHSYGTLIAASGASLGGPLGGLLADSLGWRSAFFLQVPLCLLSLTFILWKVDIPVPSGSMVQKVKRIDALGALMLASSVTLILIGLSKSSDDAISASPVPFLASGGFGLLLLLLIEKYQAKEPILPLQVLFARTPGAVALASWFISMTQFGIIYNIPLYFTIVEQTSTSYAGLHILPQAMTASISSLIAGFVMSRTGKYRKLLLLGGSCAIIGPLSMTFWNRGQTPEWVYWLTMPFAGCSFGTIFCVTLTALMASLSKSEMASATGMNFLFRSTGSVMGISLSGLILQSSLKVHLEQTSLPTKIIASIRESSTIIHHLPYQQREQAIEAFQLSLQNVFIAITVTSTLSFLCLLAIPELPLSQPTAPVVSRTSTEE